MTNIPEHTDTSSDSRILKIPKALFTLSPADARLYAAFLDLKAFNSEGVITVARMKLRVADRHSYAYWMAKLCRRGWAVKTVRGGKIVYHLRSYQHVWKSLGVERSWCPSIRKYKFSYRKINVADLPLERKEYIKKLTDLLLAQVAGNKARQIKHRLNSTQSPAKGKAETYLSCRSVAKLFGLRSSRSGHRYRARFFDVIAEPTELMKFPDGSRRYRCKRIAL